MLDGAIVATEAAIRGFRPRKRLTVSEWADTHRVLTTKSSPEPGRWRTSRNPMLREIMDCMSDMSPVREVTIKKASQVGITEGPFISTIGYYMDYAPWPVMVLLPTIDQRNSWRIQKLNPMLDDTPVIRDLIDNRSRSSSNTLDAIDYGASILYLSGGNSPNSYAQKSARVVLLDDLSRFPSSIKGEGDPVELGRTRYKAFNRNYKFLKASTATVEGACLITREYDAGDGRQYHVQCPHCAEFIVLKMDQLFADEALTEAWYTCEACGSEIDEKHKAAMFAERGHGGTARWVAQRPEIKHHRSYHISSLYAMPGLGPSWLDLVTMFRRILKGDDKEQLQVFVNSYLGETWKDSSSSVEASEMIQRANEDGFELGTIPPGVLAITIGVDTQDSWLEYTRLGWCYDFEHDRIHHTIIDHGQIHGDTSSPQVWDELETELNTPMVNSYGKEMMPRAVAIDSRGHRAKEVRDFVLRKSLKVKVYAIQGATTRMYRAIATSGSFPTKDKRGKMVRRGYCTWNVGTEYCKHYIFRNITSDGQRPIHERAFRFPAGMTEEYYNGLLSEVYDEVKKRYVQRIGSKYKRNEPIDCFDAETDVLTADGWMRFSTLTGDERLATVALDTDLIEYQYPTAIIDKPYDGEMVQIKGSRIDILVTPNHRMVTLQKEPSKTAEGKRSWRFDVKPKITLAKDLNVHTAIKLNATWQGDGKQVVRIPEFVSAQGVLIASAVEVDIFDMAAFCGWWISEGSATSLVSKTQGNRRHVVRVSQIKKKERASIGELLGKLPWAWHEEKNGYACSSRQLYDFVCQFGRLQADRVVPDFVRHADADVIGVFLDAAIAGDGWIQRKEQHHRKSRVYATTSKRLADDVQELFIKIGHAATMRIVDPEGWHIAGRSGTICKRQYHVYERLASRAYLDGGGCGKRGYFGKRVNYSGRVYCATVPNGTLIVRRGGKTFIAGNCMVYAWAIGDHREVLIGRTRKGDPYPRYWKRLADLYEPADAESGENDGSGSGGEPKKVKPATAAPVKVSSSGGFGSSDWKKRGFGR